MLQGKIEKVFGGSCRICCCCASCYWRCDDVDHCTEVQECEVLLFPCVPSAGNAHIVPCLFAWLYRGLTVPMAWHWTVCCAVSTIYVMSCLRELLNRVCENRLRSRTTVITPSALLNVILTQCCWFPQQLPLSHWLVAWCCWVMASVCCWCCTGEWYRLYI
jgi:hypothetical protein